MKQIPSPPGSLATDSTLVLVLHAFTNAPANMRLIETAVHDLRKGSHVIVPPLPFGGLSFVKPVDVARGILALIEEQIAFRVEQGWSEFEDIVFIGHSLGALMARKVYLFAGPENGEARFEDSVKDSPLVAERPWFRKVSRIILFAGMNRGWTLTSHLHFFRFVAWWISTFAADTLMAFTNDRLRLIILNSRRGAPFLTELRLQWLALVQTGRRLQADQENTQAPPRLALTVQMLGTIDDMVAPSDNIDLATGRDFIYLDVPYSGHANVIELDGSPEGRARFDRFRSALMDSPDELRKRNLVPSDEALLEANEKVNNVVFVMHGIRDTGYWTQKVARKVEQMGASIPKMYASETSSYGYFAMISFLLPSQRRKKVQWLMDRYVEARSLYPKARFSYVGHSNGTYLVTRAFLDYPACRFDRIVFAGSVVRTDYDWAGAFARGQVNAVLNYVATGDYIVAVLPGAWEMVNLQDLGSAGHNGFVKPPPRVFNIRYIKGAHSCAREEDNWDQIASFIVSDDPSPGTNPLREDLQTGWVVWAGRFAPFIWGLIIAILYGIGYCVMLLGRNEHIQHPYLALAIYLWLIWQVLTKV